MKKCKDSNQKYDGDTHRLPVLFYYDYFFCHHIQETKPPFSLRIILDFCGFVTIRYKL